MLYYLARFGLDMDWNHTAVWIQAETWEEARAIACSIPHPEPRPGVWFRGIGHSEVRPSDGSWHVPYGNKRATPFRRA